MRGLIDELRANRTLSDKDMLYLIENRNTEISEYLFKNAVEVQNSIYGKKVFVRGLIEFTNYCKNDCKYCGIRCSNTKAQRYRLSKEDILECCEEGYKLGFRTFVMQGGEDCFYTDDDIVDIVSSIRKKYQQCAITLSIGEKSYESYKRFFEAGANRYLLRHETANEEHYGKLHPNNMSLKARKECLFNLKSIGYQVGCGIMVGSPYQKNEYIVEDLKFMRELNPQMVGIGPFIQHKDTPFKGYENGSVELTLFLLGIIRLMLPNVLLPATTSLGTLDTKGREKGILAGANVLMPNLSPISVRKKYSLYDNKICTGDEAAQCKVCLENRIKNIGYEVVTDRGDYISPLL